jgi:hypothetical protein
VVWEGSGVGVWWARSRWKAHTAHEMRGTCEEERARPKGLTSAGREGEPLGKPSVPPGCGLGREKGNNIPRGVGRHL